MKNKDIVYGIKTVGRRIYVGADVDMKHYVAVAEFKDMLMFKEEKHAKEICNGLNKKKVGRGFETFKLLNPFR